MKPVFVIFLFFLFLNTGFVFSQTNDTIPPQIVNPDETEIICYCNDSVAATPKITIKSIKIDERTE